MAPFTIVKKAVEKLIRSRIETDYLGSWAGGELEVFIKREYATAENNRGQTKAYVKAVLNDQDTRYKLITQFAFADLNGAIFDMPTPKTTRKANPAPRSMHNVEKSAFRKGEYIGYGGGDVWRIVKNGNTWRATPRKDINLREFSASKLKEISAGLESLTAPERKTNPATRKRAISRPSQVTKKAPTKRLVSRRKAAAKKPVKGYFPNPIDTDKEKEILSALETEMKRLKGYFPYRIIWGGYDPKNGDFESGAVSSMRIPNSQLRKGWKVFKL